MQTNELRDVIKLPQWISSRKQFEETVKHIEANEPLCYKQGVLMCLKNHSQFIGAFLASIYKKVPIFLGNPDWKKNEWDQFFAQASPAIFFGEAIKKQRSQLAKHNLEAFKGCIMIPTGGSGGQVRFAIHYWDNLIAAARTTALFLKKNTLNSLCLLPLYHISGLMQLVRAVATEGEVIFIPIEAKKDFAGYNLSLVPTQLKRLIENESLAPVLNTFDVVFLGGAPAENELLEQVRSQQIRLSPTYGMTETAAMIAAMHPEDFIQGQKGVGRALPNVILEINDKGSLVVRCNSLFHGYYPQIPIKQIAWETGDEVQMDGDGWLTILGRADRLVITGGEKVDPLEVERAILATGLIHSVTVFAIKCPEWGARLAAVCVKKENGLTEKVIKQTLKLHLVKYKIPKNWIFVDNLPYDEKGKLNKLALELLIK